MNKNTITILAIESSCDDTAAAIIQDGKILANMVANQDVHKDYGGVVPELASRAHQQNIVPVVDMALRKAAVQANELSAIAFTKGPGLLGSLLVGSSFAKSMALGLGIPLIEVDHMQAHVLAHFIESPQPPFPFLCLTVSGGHTQIVLIEDYLKMEIIGSTLDDAAGEAFDKAAKILGLAYPGGPLIDKFAATGNPQAFTFSQPHAEGLNFSFSGLKTAFLYFIQAQLKEDPKFIEKYLHDICASIQYTIIEILIKKISKAAEEKGINEIALAGGVSANSALRKKLTATGKEKGWNVYIPAFEYCTDNAAMIAIAAHYKFLQKEFSDQKVVPSARLKMT